MQYTVHAYVPELTMCAVLLSYVRVHGASCFKIMSPGGSRDGSRRRHHRPFSKKPRAGNCCRSRGHFRESNPPPASPSSLTKQFRLNTAHPLRSPVGSPVRVRSVSCRQLHRISAILFGSLVPLVGWKSRNLSSSSPFLCWRVWLNGFRGPPF